MNNRFNWLIGLTVLVLSVLVIVLGLKHFHKPKSPGVRPKVLSELYAKDLAVLENSKAEERDLVAALIRLGRAKDPLAYEVALQRRSSSSLELRRAAALALGKFETEQSLGALQALLKDPEQQVRWAAMEALGSEPSPLRIQVLQGLTASEGLSALDQFELALSLLNLEDKANFDKNVEKLVSLVAAMEPRLQLPNILRVIGLVQKHQAIRSFFEREMKAGENQELQAVGKTYLQSF